MKRMLSQVHQPAAPKRSAFILGVVLITVVLLSLSVYNYTDTMLVEQQATLMGGRDLIARTAAESAIELAATRIMEHDTDAEINLFNDPESFRGYLISDSENERTKVYCSLIAFDEANSISGGIRFGLSNQNAKFNINTLLDLEQLDDGVEEEEKQQLAYVAMSYLPNMNDDIVDAILDWLDSDEERRPGGAESNEYESLAIPYECKNGPMDSIEELLKVQGVTPEFFYGEDRNHNGIMDVGEDTNGDGFFDPGWQGYLTATSRERNTTPDGDDKINLNMGQMTDLFDAVEEQFGVDAAKFVVGVRIAGTEFLESAGGLDAATLQPDIDGDITREGIDLTIPPLFQINSIYDLIGVDTNPVSLFDSGTAVYSSPWAEDANSLLSQLPELEQYFTTTDDSFLEGRVNINQARREVLLAGLAIAEIPENVADAIIAARPAIELESLSSDILAQRNTAAWILAEGIVDLQQLRDAGPYITVGGDAYSFQAVGYFGDGGPTTRLEAMIDATVFPPKVIQIRDLTDLGRGYSPSLLKPIPVQ